VRGVQASHAQGVRSRLDLPRRDTELIKANRQRH